MKIFTTYLLLLQFVLAGCQHNHASPSSTPNSEKINKKVSVSDTSKRKRTPSIAIPNENAKQILKETKQYKFIAIEADFNDRAFLNLVKRMENSAKKMEEFVGRKSTLPQIEVYLYPSAEKKGLKLNNTDQNTIDFEKNASHIVFNDVYENNFLQLENQLILRHLLGKPKMEFLELGLGIYFTENWQRKGYEYWTAKLYLSSNMPSLKRLLLNEQLQHESPLLKGAVSGAFAAFLIEHWSQDKFLKEYKNAVFSEEKLKELESEWLQFLDNLSEKYKVQIYEHRLQRKKASTPYFKGFNFAHEGYDIYNGYISQKATNALIALQKIGANSIAIVPYTGMRKPNSLHVNDMRLWQRAGMENDESVVHAAFQARKLEMSVLLKPQIWVHDSWPGDVDFSTEEEWQAFFERYERWILHYALLAEMYDFEAFCVGVEFVKATLKNPEEWTAIIQKVKSLYSGSVTYAANWGEEFENTTLWNFVDFIGINCYYPLSKKENPSDRELKEGFKTALERIKIISEKYDKKVVFTEIGFRSIEKPWVSPHHYDWGSQPPYSEVDQKRCYEIVMSGLQNEKQNGRDWSSGIFWWKWPSYLEHSREAKTEFAPNGKEAERVVEEFFKN